MTPATIIATLRDRGARLALREGDQLTVTPRSALDDELREAIRLEKATLVTFLKGDLPVPPDPTPVPTPCPSCGAVVFWRQSGDTRLHCAGCIPCPSPSGAYWYTAPTPATADTLSALSRKGDITASEIAVPADDDATWLGLRVRSRILDAEVWIVRTTADAEQLEAEGSDGLMIFTVDELLAMADMAEADLKKLVQVKRYFKGAVIESVRVRGTVGTDRGPR